MRNETHDTDPAHRRRRRPRWLMWAAAIVGGLLLVGVALDALLDEPVRRMVERRMNEKLDGYTVRLGELDVGVFTLSLELGDLELVQDAHPDPPVARLARADVGLHWRALLHFDVVADVELESPQLYVHRAHYAAERADEVPMESRGWQDALQAMTLDVEVNRLTVRDGALTYVEARDGEPLELTRVELRASNIRNVDSVPGAYPSPLRLEAQVFDEGRLTVNGDADFLAEPHVAVRVGVVLEGLDLGHLAPLARRADLVLRGGTLSVDGSVEYGPTARMVALDNVTVQRARVDYVHTPGGAKRAEREAKEVQRAVGADQEAPPELDLRVGSLVLSDAELGFVNRTTRPHFRVFVSSAELEVLDFANTVEDEATEVKLRGRFMGSGRAVADATFRPEGDGPDFDLALAIEGTRLRSLNDLIRAYADFDVQRGAFFLYTQIHVADGRIRGYVKPLFRDLQVYDSEQDEDDDLSDKAYELTVGAVSELLENEEHEDVATRIDISGPLENPDKSGTWTTVLRVLRNAFIDAILPRFDRVMGRRAG